MAYEVLARKWRPQQFDDVVGQEHVTRTLKNAIESKRIAHAYLFVGPRGIGKTSLARIFAKALNCKNGPTMTPCGKCDSCKEITLGNSLDVIEIDGASNNSVDQIRDLRETVKYVPTRAPYKIYIIDEVHMLSSAAFNALLKTLEEPPAHVKFFFATTESEKVLPTIISRCQRFDLRRIPVPAIVQRLQEIAQAEKIKITDDALLAIARGAEGGLRDAESALDQLISFKGGSIKEEDVLSVFGLVARATMEDLVERVLTADIKGLLTVVAELDRSGKDFLRLVQELLSYVRNLLVAMQVSELSSEMDLTDSQIATLTRQAKLTDTTRALRIASVLSEAEDKMRRALSRRTMLELALIRCARAVTVVSMEDILGRLNALAEGSADPGTGGEGAARREAVAPLAAPMTPATTIPAASPAAPPGVPHDALEDAAESEEMEIVGGEDPEPPATVRERPAPERSSPGSRHGPGAAAGDEKALLKKHWKDFVEKVGAVSPYVRSALRDAWPVSVADGKVVIGLNAEFEDEYEKLGTSRNRVAVERVLTSFLDREVSLEYRLLDDKELQAGTEAPADREAHASAPSPVRKGSAAVQAGSHGGGRRTRDELMGDPHVLKVQELFGGSVIDIR